MISLYPTFEVNTLSWQFIFVLGRVTNMPFSYNFFLYLVNKKNLVILSRWRPRPWSWKEKTLSWNASINIIYVHYKRDIWHIRQKQIADLIIFFLIVTSINTHHHLGVINGFAKQILQYLKKICLMHCKTNRQDLL